MIRFGIPPIGGKGWFGGWMYMSNLIRILAHHGDPEIELVLFLDPERANDRHIRDLPTLSRTRIVVDPVFAENRIRSGIGRTIATGRNASILNAFRREGIDVAFAPALYLGWRSEIPTVAWFPDFQHRRLPAMFSRSAWWKRELGFRALIASSSAILLSSYDAERDCLTWYPAAHGRTYVARFAIPLEGWPDADTAWSQLRAAGIPEDFVFLPNQLWQHKNHGLAIEAAGQLVRRGIHRPILVTGHSEDPRRPGYRDWLAAQIVALGAENAFRLMGSVDHDLVRALMIGANALLNPSKCEGWSTTVEEAKAVGTPTLLSDLPVHREQAPDARLFGIEDATALADAIAAMKPRSLALIRSTMAKAQQETACRQRSFAEAVSEAVVAVAHEKGNQLR